MVSCGSGSTATTKTDSTAAKVDSTKTDSAKVTVDTTAGGAKAEAQVK